MHKNEAVKAKALIASFPSKTFPNHYFIVTGLVPDEHGIVANRFYHRKLNQILLLCDRVALENPAYYGSNPIWFVEAEDDKIDEVQSSLQEVDDIKVWNSSDVPPDLNFGTNDNITNLVVLADSAWGLSWKSPVGYSNGTHGYDPKNSDMHTIFYAFGPDFKEGYVHPPFKNTNVYVLLAELLRIVPAPTSGNLQKVEGLLNR